MIKNATGAVAVLLLLLGCSQESQRVESQASPRIRKNIKIDAPKTGDSMVQGAAVSFAFSHRENTAIDSVIISWNGFEQSFPGDTFTIPNPTLKTGVPSITATVYAGGTAERVFPKINVLAKAEPERYSYRVLGEYPHDENAYTQGLFFHGNELIESTGSENSGVRGGSTLRRVKFETGEILNNINLEQRYFGEGATIWKDRIYQLTWQAQQCFVYDFDFSQVQTFNYTGEGWGLTTWGDTLIMSNGTEILYFINPVDFSVIDTRQVYDQKGKRSRLNELEMIGDMLFANVYEMDDEILVIDPYTGAVSGIVDCRGLIDRSAYSGLDYVLNGIAVDDQERLFITGKWWPKLYEIDLIKRLDNL